MKGTVKRISLYFLFLLFFLTPVSADYEFDFTTFGSQINDNGVWHDYSNSLYTVSVDNSQPITYSKWQMNSGGATGISHYGISPNWASYMRYDFPDLPGTFNITGYSFYVNSVAPGSSSAQVYARVFTKVVGDGTYTDIDLSTPGWHNITFDSINYSQHIKDRAGSFNGRLADFFTADTKTGNPTYLNISKVVLRGSAVGYDTYIIFSSGADWQTTQINQSNLTDIFYINTFMSNSVWDPDHDYYTLWIYNPDGSLLSNSIDIAAQIDQVALTFDETYQTGNYTFKIHSWYWDTFLATAILNITDISCTICRLTVNIPTENGYIQAANDTITYNIFNGASVDYLYNDTVNLTPIPIGGYNLHSWDVDGVSQSSYPYSLSINSSNHTVTAYFNTSPRPIPTPPPPGTNNTIVYGYVLDNTSHCDEGYCAVPGALVRISNGTWSAAVIADNYGYYQLNFYKTGYYNFQISAPGYKTGQFNDEYLSMNYPVNFINFNIQPLIAGQYIDGYVEGSDRITGISGASVKVFNASGFARWATTDINGYYNISMSGAANGYYNFTVSAIGYITENDNKYVVLGERDYWVLNPQTATQAMINISTVPGDLGFGEVTLLINDRVTAIFDGTMLFNATIGTKISLHAYNSCGGTFETCTPEPVPNWNWKYFTHPNNSNITWSINELAQTMDWVVTDTNYENITVVYAQHQGVSVTNMSWSPNPINVGQSSTVSWISTSSLNGIRYYYELRSSANELLDLEVITDSGITNHSYSYNFYRADNYSAVLYLDGGYYSPFATSILYVGTASGRTPVPLEPFVLSPTWMSGAIIFTAGVAGAAVAGAPGFAGGAAVGTVIVFVGMGLDIVYIFVLSIAFLVVLLLFAGNSKEPS